jgi:two-component system response regulator LytT
MNCIIIEDEPAAQSVLELNLSLCPDLHWCGTFADAFSAQAYLAKKTVDLIFLDINLPEMSGVSFLRSLVHPPMVIFTTAYSKYAVEGFDLEAIDFLLKPFSFERFSKAVNKARERFNERNVSASPQKLNVTSGRRIYQISVTSILCLEACGDYVTLFCTDKKLLVHGTLKSWEEKLKSQSFLKIHRTTIVNVSKIDHLEGNMVQIGEHKLPVSEQFREQLLERMFGRKEV